MNLTSLNVRSVLAAIVALVIVGATATALPSTAGAAGPVIPPPPPPPLGFELHGSGGYNVSVYGVAGQEGAPDQVLVKAAARGGSVTYHFPGVVEEGSIQADLGAYGAISVVFRPQWDGGSSVAELGCDRGLSSSAGYYEGTISFHAPGLTTAKASRAKGDDGLALSVLCAAESESFARSRPGTYLAVSGGPLAPTMTVMRQSPGMTLILAGISESRSGVAIERSVSIAASAEVLRHRGLRSATLRLPAPFSGSATFARQGHKTSWRGNLRVDFPGRPNVPLTGNGLRAQLSRIPGGRS